MISRLISWLVEGSTDAVLDPSWFDHRERLAEYEAFTARQLQSCVVKDVAATNRDRFWQHHADKRIANALKFPRKLA